MIELQHISKAYRTPSGLNHVLSDLSLAFPARANVGILGQNGAGKSTLLRIISGVEKPDHGIVRRAGRVSWPIGFAGGFNGSLTGEDNCRFVARIYGEDVDRVVGFTEEFAEIGNYFYMPVRTYSSGMKARLAFGLSMAIDFSVYLVDEVTAVGDKRFQQKCHAAFAERQERSSVIMVSHNMSTISQYCEKAALLKDGVLKLFQSVEQAAEVYNAGLAV
jgi:capsular polysaccharide transport system ATP-binding protein